MKKYVLIMLAIVVLLLVVAYVKLFAKQTSYHKTIVASTNSVLVLGNLDKARVKVVTADTDEIKVDLKGSADDILSILMLEAGIYTELNFSDEHSDVSGIITVPEGVLLDISLSGDKVINIDDAGGKNSVVGKDSFLVDSNSLKSLTVNDSGEVSLDSWGDLTVWDDESWSPLDNNNNGPSENAVYCGIGSQAIRNYCCETEKSGQNEPTCDGVGHWIFDNVQRDCSFACDAVEEGEGATEIITDCSIGSQAERNNCCVSQHVGEYQGCIGSWYYNNAAGNCNFGCDTYDDPINDQEGDEAGEPFSYGDPISDFCVDIIGEEDRDLCCNDALKNNLSSGPRPGFPDCIGKWNFDIQNGCKFECAEHAEMMEILNELKRQAQ